MAGAGAGDDLDAAAAARDAVRGSSICGGWYHDGQRPPLGKMSTAEIISEAHRALGVIEQRGWRSASETA